MQGANAFPFRRIGLEIGGRGRGPCLAHMGQTRGIGLAQAGIGQGRQGGAQLRSLAPVGGAIEYPASFLEPFQEARLAQELEMAGNAWLALTHDFDQFADREFRLPQEQQQAQPGGIPCRAQHGHKPVHYFSQKHINISLYARPPARNKS